ncbi:MAG: transcriptional regulator, partial [Paracoccaceae bacterium]
MKYGFGAYTVDTERLELSEEGTAISLQPQAFSLLVFLIENAERVVSKDEIIDSVWQGRIVGDGTLNARINALRRALGDDGVTQSMIKTFPRKGFRFVGKLSNVVAVSSPESKNIAPQGSIAVLPFVNISADQE